MRKSSEIKLVASLFGVLLTADFVGFTVSSTLQSASGFADWESLVKAVIASGILTVVLTVLFVQRHPVLMRLVSFFGIAFTGGYMENAWIGLSAVPAVFFGAFLYWRIVKGGLTPDETSASP